ncbi:MAG: hypothetical protein JO288_23770 [Hyphomicrobiales bacterium]|nr:hypothetical protein [Hyphomicrobiales bacterium]
MGAREVMEEEVSPTPNAIASWRPIEPATLDSTGVARIGAAIASARRPLAVTSFLGRNLKAVSPFVALCRRLGIGVLESVPSTMNFPHSESLYQGNQWNEPDQNPVLADADVILVLDSDVPWIPTVSKPSQSARIFHIDVDPLKQQMPFWHINAEASHRADAEKALEQLGAWFDANPPRGEQVAERYEHYGKLHADRTKRLAALEIEQEDGSVTSEYLIARLRALAGDEALYLNEGVSHYHTVFNHLAPDTPGCIFTSGGGSLGWNGGAAVGVKLARPDKTVIALTGDGSFMFSVPSSVHWMARRYTTPFLQIIFNNRGWKSPKLSALAIHPDGCAARANHLDTSFDPAPDYVGVAAAAGGAWGTQVRKAKDVEPALMQALGVVRQEKRCAVIDVWLPHH